MNVLFLKDICALFSAITKEAVPRIETLTVLFIVMIHFVMGFFLIGFIGFLWWLVA